MLKVTYRMSRWPEGKTAVWIARDHEWVKHVALVWADSLTILTIEDA